MNNRKKKVMKKNATIEEVREALALIIQNKDEKSLNYAVVYAREGMGMSGDELYAQCLYVRGNMSRWRGDTATWVRDVLKRCPKGNML